MKTKSLNGKTEEKLRKEIEDLKLINQKAEEDFNATLNSSKNNIYDTDVLEKTFLEIAQRVERKQYTPKFFAYHMNIYWRQIIQHFRNMYDKDIREAKAQIIKEVEEIIDKELSYVLCYGLKQNLNKEDIKQFKKIFNNLIMQQIKKLGGVL